MESVPLDSLQYLLANRDLGSEIDDNGVEIGVDGTVGSFSAVLATSEEMRVQFINQNGTLLYEVREQRVSVCSAKWPWLCH